MGAAEPPRYPIYVISKGRHDACLTADFLLRDGVPFKLVVEPQEVPLYAEKYGIRRLIQTPFSNLGQGSIPARNFVWEHARQRGAERHWILDDNIRGTWFRYNGVRLRCRSGLAFRALETFVDRYENVAVAGLNYYMFAPNGQKAPPFYLNVHVYSFMLIRTDLPQRWRGRYNEDTDLCLQVLSAGHCTVLLNAFLAWKQRTMTMKGGNTAELYKGDGRLRMARALERQWPGVVETKRRFGRPQHVVRDAWRAFDTPLVRRKDLDWGKIERDGDPFGVRLLRHKVAKSPAVNRLFEDYQERGK